MRISPYIDIKIWNILFVDRTNETRPSLLTGVLNMAQNGKMILMNFLDPDKM